jgi:2-isopropylmalate synthase
VGQKIAVYDTTLRDGAQGPGVKFSSDDQLTVVRELDALGVHYIEGGQPSSNPKALELFQRVKSLKLKNAKMTAFGSTRHPRTAVEDDANLLSLLEAETEIVTIFAKTSPLHVTEVLGVSLDTNLKIIRESVTYLRSKGRRVFVDAEHFFDGYDADAEYALKVLACSAESGAEILVLCDTNGGHLPHEISEITATVRRRLPALVLGIHTHNDSGCAGANSIAAVLAGAVHVQGTINGYGERTGNADLCTVIPNLQLKLGYAALTPEQLSRLTHASHLVAELANMTPRDHAPYVGRDAFTHKAGMHADAVMKIKHSYEHIQPTLVGNATHVTVSEMAGRSSLLQKAAEFGIALDKDHPETKQILARVKKLENEGYEFEGADASLELIMRKVLGQHRSFFTTTSFHVHVNQEQFDRAGVSEATVKLVLPNEQVMHTVAEGHGPVDALNNALRKALEQTYPELRQVHLEDYKVRILDGKLATSALTRVLIESSDKEGNKWNTVGVSENIITASYIALLDSIEYRLLAVRGHAQ